MCRSGEAVLVLPALLLGGVAQLGISNFRTLPIFLQFFYCHIRNLRPRISNLIVLTRSVLIAFKLLLINYPDSARSALRTPRASLSLLFAKSFEGVEASGSDVKSNDGRPSFPSLVLFV